MEEGAAVEAAARAIRDADLTGCDNIWTLWAKAALDAAYPALLAELRRQAAVEEAARRLVRDIGTATSGDGESINDLLAYNDLCAALDTP